MFCAALVGLRALVSLSSRERWRLAYGLLLGTPLLMLTTAFDVTSWDVGHAAMNDAALTDPRISALRQRVHVSEDPAMSALAPRLRPARVMVALKDGRSLSHAVQSHRGDFNQPFQETEIRAKFRELAGVLLTGEGATAVEALVSRCEQWRDIGELAGALRHHERSNRRSEK